MEDKDIMTTIVRLRKLEAKGREVKNEIEGIRLLLREEFDARGTDEIRIGRYCVRRVSYERQQFDTKLFREQQPVAYEAYCKPTTVSEIRVVG